MELKDFQQEVLDSFDSYLDKLVEENLRVVELEKLSREKPELNIPVPDFTEEAWEALGAIGKLPKARANVPFSPRTDGAARPVPSVTLKIPTGGGKTLLAAQAVSRIMSKWVRAKHGFVLWIAPNESIYSQTHKALNNREHPYRQILDRAAAGRFPVRRGESPLDFHLIPPHPPRLADGPGRCSGTRPPPPSRRGRAGPRPPRGPSCWDSSFSRVRQAPVVLLRQPTRLPSRKLMVGVNFLIIFLLVDLFSDYI
jgi:hypothetical protein